jgi:hypothetical protein
LGNAVIIVFDEFPDCAKDCFEAERIGLKYSAGCQPVTGMIGRSESCHGFGNVKRAHPLRDRSIDQWLFFHLNLLETALHCSRSVDLEEQKCEGRAVWRNLILQFLERGQKSGFGNELCKTTNDRGERRR